MTSEQPTEQENFNLNNFLPHGVMLRDLLRDSQVTEGDIKSILRTRGIYVQASDKEVTIPILMNCLLSSQEFNLLRDKHFSREDSLKHKTLVVHLDSDKHDLMQLIGRPEINLSANSPCRLLHDPKFLRRENGKELVVEYKLEKPNRSRDWSSHNTIHRGSIVVRQKGSIVQITSEFTANEVKDLNDVVLRDIEQRFKKSGHLITDKGILKITAGSLTNSQRIKFLMSFTNGSNDGLLAFEKIPYVSFGPDRIKQLPTPMGWMQDRVRALMIRGQQQSSLHDLQFLTDNHYQDYVVLESVDATYLMQYRGYRIHCNITYGFPKYLKTLSSSIEFEVQLSRLTVHDSSGKRVSFGDKETREAEALILKSFDETKLENYQIVASTTLIV